MEDEFIKYLEAQGMQNTDLPSGGGYSLDPQTYIPNLMSGYEGPAYAPSLGGGQPIKDPYQAAVDAKNNPAQAQARAQPGPAGMQTQPAANRSGAYSATPGKIEAYIREAARKRGIDEEIALRIAEHEGGYDDNDPARRGTFATGSSWWPFQLHYGGAGTPYAHYGTTAGMGNDFTERTGWQPGDPAAVFDSIDFALDHARRYGWSAWYGRGPAGVGEWDGIPR
jgi:hypothetical protein